MKHFERRHTMGKIPYMLLCAVLMVCSIGCIKHGPNSRDEGPIANYPNEVLDKWISLQVRLMKDVVGQPNVVFTRPYAYSGIVAYESIAQGISDDKWLTIHWNGLSGLPQADEWKRYFWPQTLNAAMAEINRKFFPTATSVDSAAIDSLESAIRISFSENLEVIQRSSTFGASVADAVFNWSETDGYKHASDPYHPPVGLGLWVPTPPAFAAASTPYWGNLRTVIAGSTEHTQCGPPPFPYSEDPSSDFYKMVLQVYTASQNLTPDQTAMALYWRDIPGVTSPGHWLNILHEVLQQTNVRLGQAALAYALTGASINDASIICWHCKYTYNQVRPISYIRGVMGYSAWNSLLTTPAHPEYPSAHAVISSATAEAFTRIFGNIGSFTDHTYDYLGFAPRTFSSFRAIGIDAGNSRLYAGLHYQPSIDTGLIQGTKVAINIFDLILKNPSKSDY
jgi:hypothetical protein